jgi:hypothetical protein
VAEGPRKAGFRECPSCGEFRLEFCGCLLWVKRRINGANHLGSLPKVLHDERRRWPEMKKDDPRGLFRSRAFILMTMRGCPLRRLLHWAPRAPCRDRCIVEGMSNGERVNRVAGLTIPGEAIGQFLWLLAMAYSCGIIRSWSTRSEQLAFRGLGRKIIRPLENR